MEKGYMISDASKMLEVENHVLRYWEEELELPIPRNELGHRCYGDPEMKMLRAIKDLKEKGFQLKAIKKVLPDLDRLEDMDPQELFQLREELNGQVMKESQDGLKGTVTPIDQARDRYEKRQRTWQERSYELEQIKEKEDPVRVNQNQAASLERLLRFEDMMRQLIRGTMEELNQESEKRICDEVTIKLQKEMNYLMMQREEVQEKQVSLLKEILEQVRKENGQAEKATAGEAAVTAEGSAGAERTRIGFWSRRKKAKKKLFAKSAPS